MNTQQNSHPAAISNSHSFNISFFSNKTDNSAKQETLSWDSLVEILKKPDIRNHKDGRLISGAIFKDGWTKEIKDSVTDEIKKPAKFIEKWRRNETAIESSLLILDFDHIDKIDLSVWQNTGISFACYTTFSHATKEKPCAYRLVIPLSNPIPADKYPLLYQWAFEQSNGLIDPACKDISRMQYLPAYPKERQKDFKFFSNVGAFLDWQSVINTPKTLDKPIIETSNVVPIQTRRKALKNSHEQNKRDFSAWVESAINAECDKVRNAQANVNRNVTLNTAAFRLGQIIATSWANANQSSIESLLLDAALASGLEQSESKATIASGLESGKLQPREMPETAKQTVKLQSVVNNQEKTIARGRPKKEWQNELKELVDSFNKTHAQVLIGGKHRIMIKIDAANSPNKRDAYEFVVQAELEKIYQNTRIKISETTNKNTGETTPKYANHIKAWASDNDCNLYRRGVIFKPSVDNTQTISNDYYNTWQGYTVKPIEGDWTLIKYHIEEIICSGKTDLIEYFYNWIAFTFQNPDQPAGSAVVLRGLKGTGKGMIANFLMNLWGNHALHITAANHLVGNFNGHFNDICFVYADEAFFSGDRQHEGVLKGLITEKNIVIERKGIDATQQPNYLKVFMSTNSDYAVPASKDERRYFVLDVSEERKGDIEYFKSLSNDINDKDIQAAFLHDILKHDIRNFHTGQIPETIGLKEQRYHSLDSAGKWVCDCLARGYFISTADEEWINEISTKDLYGSYIEYCTKMKVSHYDMQTEIKLSGYLKTLFIKKDKIRISRAKGFDLGTLEDAIARIESIEKISINTD